MPGRDKDTYTAQEIKQGLELVRLDLDRRYGPCSGLGYRAALDHAGAWFGVRLADTPRHAPVYDDSLRADLQVINGVAERIGL